jgi:hypothetical protein
LTLSRKHYEQVAERLGWPEGAADAVFAFEAQHSDYTVWWSNGIYHVACRGENFRSGFSAAELSELEPLVIEAEKTKAEQAAKAVARQLWYQFDATTGDQAPECS